MDRSLRNQNENDVHFAIIQAIEKFQTAVIDAQNLVYVKQHSVKRIFCITCSK